MYVHLDYGRKVDDFVEATKKIGGKCELVYGRAIIDPSSTLGIFTADLSTPLVFRYENDTPDSLALLKPFIANPKNNKEETE